MAEGKSPAWEVEGEKEKVIASYYIRESRYKEEFFLERKWEETSGKIEFLSFIFNEAKSNPSERKKIRKNKDISIGEEVLNTLHT